MAPENEKAGLIRQYMMDTQREREREREQEQEFMRQLDLLPASEKATLLLAREKTNQMKLGKGHQTMRSKSQAEGTSFLTIFIITIT